MRLLLSLLGLVALSSAACSDYSDCATCTENSFLLMPCSWCATTSKCHMQSLLSCPRLADDVKHAFDCPAAQPVAPNKYNETFAAEIATRVAASTCANDEATVKRCLGNANVELVGAYKNKCDFWGNECMSVLGVNHQEGAIVIAFRASKDMSQVLSVGLNSLFGLRKQFTVNGTNIGQVAGVFLKGFESLYFDTRMERDLLALIEEYPAYEGWFTGHSLGGSLTSLASAYASHMGLFAKNKIKMVTFGQPRTGDAEFVQSFERLVPNHFRVIHNNDGVPDTPPRDWGLTPLMHHRYEVWYPNDMTPGSSYEIQTRADSGQGYDTVGGKNIFEPHHLYFNTNLIKWIDTDCATIGVWA